MVQNRRLAILNDNVLGAVLQSLLPFDVSWYHILHMSVEYFLPLSNRIDSEELTGRMNACKLGMLIPQFGITVLFVSIDCGLVCHAAP